MKVLKSLLLLGAFVFATSLFAHGDNTAEERASASTEILKSELNLSAEQEQSVNQILLKKEKQIDFLYEKYEDNQDKLVEEIKRYTNEANEHLKIVFTEEQYATFQNKNFKF